MKSSMSDSIFVVFFLPNKTCATTIGRTAVADIHTFRNATDTDHHQRDNAVLENICRNSKAEKTFRIIN